MKLAIVVGSTRPKRISPNIAKWIKNEADKLENVEAYLVDLKDYNLPLFDHAKPPQYDTEPQSRPDVQKWLDQLEEADAVVIVTPEYNRAYPGVLKNALDFVAFQLAKKPVMLAGHGSTGGAQAVAGLRITLPGLQAVTAPNVMFLLDPFVKFDENGKPAEGTDVSMPQQSLKSALEDLAWYADALKTAR
jgi:NAD(P)H-dependent FMN reductase